MKEKDFKVSLHSLWFILCNNIAFVKYEPLLELLEELGGCRGREQLHGNANLRSKRMKSELIACLGMQLQIYDMKSIYLEANAGFKSDKFPY